MGDDEGDREGDDGLDRLERERGKGGKLEKWCKGVLRGHKKVRLPLYLFCRIGIREDGGDTNEPSADFFLLLD
jgi:hypothetical protein